MATVLFAHDGYIGLENDGIYSDTYNNKIVKRYLNIAENVVFLVRTTKLGDNYNYNDLNKITVSSFKVKGIKNFKSLKGIFDYKTVIEQVKHEVFNADYIVARIPSDLGFLAVRYAKLYNKRYMIEVVGCPWDSYKSHSKFGKIVAPYYFWKQKKTVKDAPYAIYVTNEFLQNRYPNIGKSIGCSDVDITSMSEDILRRRIDRLQKTETRSMIFGTMGALHMKYKGYDSVIKTISKLNSEGYSHKYFIAGSGDSSWLKSVIHKYKAENFVTIVPSMAHEQVFKWLDNIDFYIQPSKTEGLPRALIEAMSRGLPALGTKVGGIVELLEDICLISNSKENVNEMYTILKGYDIENMKKRAIHNFNVAQNYRKDIIESRRIEFLKEVFKRKEN